MTGVQTCALPIWPSLRLRGDAMLCLEGRTDPGSLACSGKAVEGSGCLGDLVKLVSG